MSSDCRLANGLYESGMAFRFGLRGSNISSFGAFVAPSLVFFNCLSAFFLAGRSW